MRTNLFLTMALIILTSMYCSAQISFKTEYFGTSDYRDKNNNKKEGSEGSALIHQINLKLPISQKVNEDGLPIVWGIDASGSYASLKNQNLDGLVLDNITNYQVSLFHMRPLNEKWSMILLAGAGVYTAEKPFSKISGDNILGNAGAIFIKKINPNLDLGGGVALNNAFGFPMIFPAFYFNYNYEGKYVFRASVLNGLEILAGYNLNENLSLNVVAEMNGQLALLEKQKKDVIFTHQYIVFGFKPELKVNKNISIPLTVGLNAARLAYFNDRSLKALFSGINNDAHFTFSPYAAAELKINF